LFLLKYQPASAAQQHPTQRLMMLSQQLASPLPREKNAKSHGKNTTQPKLVLRAFGKAQRQALGAEEERTSRLPRKIIAKTCLSQLLAAEQL
jgi:hypothetical protein